MSRTLSLVLNKLLPLLLLVIHTTAYAEDGSQLWLRYTPVNKASVSGVEGKAAQVLRQYYSGGKVTLLVDRQQENEEGFRITMSDKGVIVTSSTERGLLYGAFALLRGETGYQKPFFKYRILNHWDNLDGSIERGYAGKSIFWNDHLTFDSHRLEDYAKANASIGINGVVLNNVNASPKVLSTAYLRKVHIPSEGQGDCRYTASVGYPCVSLCQLRFSNGLG